MKTFYRTDNIGKAKYTISHHDGKQTYKDGSPFFEISIFSNKRKMNAFATKLLRDGYRERGAC